MSFSFQVLHKDDTTSARTGLLETLHGSVETPVFMPVGTQGTVKALRPDELRDCGAQIILANTYHLYLRPGHETIQKLGGLHSFMNWPGPILTDSGGFQVFSLAKLRKIHPDGVMFQSHIDGSRHFLTPQKALEIQEALGTDIMMCLDDCPPYPATPAQVAKSLGLTVSWARTSIQAKTSPKHALVGIIQGGTYPALRAAPSGRPDKPYRHEPLLLTAFDETWWQFLKIVPRNPLSAKNSAVTRFEQLPVPNPASLHERLRW